MELGRPDEPGQMRPVFGAAFATIVAASAAPYGYTVSVWSTGRMLMNSHGTPRVHDVFAFAVGALAGFGMVGVLAHRATGRHLALDDAGDRVLTGVLHWLAVGIAIGAAALLAQINGWAAWPIASFAGTVLYLFGASLQLELVALRHRTPRPTRDG